MPSVKPFTLRLPKRILFGEDTATKVSDFAKEFGAKSTLVVTDPVLRKIGLVDQVLEPLREAGIQPVIFDAVEPEPSIRVAEGAVKIAREGRYDLIVGLGGGSALDMAKVASVAATNSGSVASFIGVDRVQHPGLPKILLPTTSGTGSEVTTIAMVSSEEDVIKTAIVSPHLLADVAIVDPSLTLTMPPKLTAATGLDALGHAVETVMSVDSNPLTDALAFQAIRLIFTSLRRAYEKGDDASARRNMALASLCAAMAFGTSGVCAGHAAAYSFAVKYKRPHGVSCAIALPYVMEFNAPVCMLALAGVAEAAGVRSRSQHRAAFNAVRVVRALIRDLEIPLSLKEIGVSRDVVPQLAKDMLKSARLIARNPRPISEREAEELLTRMYEGKALPLSRFGKKP